MSPRRGGLALATLVALMMGLPWSGAVLRMTGDVWRDQAEVPLFVFWYASAFLLAVGIGAWDVPLGLLVAYVAALGLLWPTQEGIASLQYVIAAAILIAFVRALAQAGWTNAIVTALILTAVGQVVYSAGQVFGYDPAWFGATWRSDLRPIGSVRSTNLLALYVATITPLATPTLVPVLLLGIGLTKSALGLSAALAGLLIRYRRHLTVRRWIMASVGSLTLIGFLHAAPVTSATARVTFWRLGMHDLIPAPIFGYGIGGWAERVPPLYAAQVKPRGRHARATPTHAHNELVQWVYEGGLLAGLIAMIGVVVHRRAWRHPVAGGALVASLIGCLGHAPLHLASTALPILIVYGLATSEMPA